MNLGHVRVQEQSVLWTGLECLANPHRGVGITGSRSHPQAISQICVCLFYIIPWIPRRSPLNWQQIPCCSFRCNPPFLRMAPGSEETFLGTVGGMPSPRQRMPISGVCFLNRHTCIPPGYLIRSSDARAPVWFQGVHFKNLTFGRTQFSDLNNYIIIS